MGKARGVFVVLTCFRLQQQAADAFPDAFHEALGPLSLRSIDGLGDDARECIVRLKR